MCVLVLNTTALIMFFMSMGFLITVSLSAGDAVLPDIATKPPKKYIYLKYVANTIR